MVRMLLSSRDPFFIFIFYLGNHIDLNRTVFYKVLASEITVWLMKDRVIINFIIRLFNFSAINYIGIRISDSLGFHKIFVIAKKEEISAMRHDGGKPTP